MLFRSVTPKEEETNLPPVIENISIDKLSGPKILGKIELPVDSDTRPKRESAEEKQKRKRIPIQKKPGFEGGAQRGNKAIPDGRDAQGRPGQGGNRFQKNQGAGKKPEEKIFRLLEIVVALNASCASSAQGARPELLQAIQSPPSPR